MHINVTKLLASDIGASAEYEFANTKIDLADLDLVSGINLRLTLSNTGDGLVAQGVTDAEITLECHRCLRQFATKVSADIGAEFSRQPTEDQWPIAKNGDLDPAELIRQELIVALPAKLICEPDCPGLCLQCGKRQDEQHKHHQSTRSIKEI